MRAEQLHRAAVQYASPSPAPQAPPLDALVGLSVSRREEFARQSRRWLNGRYFDSARDRRLRADFDDFVEDNHDSFIGTRDLLILTGDNCLGKSTLLTTWAMRHHLQVIGEWTDPDCQPRHQHHSGPGEVLTVPTVPVLLLSLPADTTVAKFDQQLFLALCYSSTAFKQGHYLDVLRRHRVGVVIIDDLHLLATTDKRGRHVLDHIKEMLTAVGEHGISVIVAGAHLHRHPIMDDPQVTRRAREHQIQPYCADTGTDRESWQWFLKEAEDHIRPLLPRLEPGTLYNDLAPAALERSNGVMRDVVTLLKQAPVHAIRDGSWTITTQHLDAAQLSIDSQRRAEARKQRAASTTGQGRARPLRAGA
ncbi:TniB family NTP-binding protein [Arsenicicoccus bolidensis]|uniref:TniB family NTP-binding protein n=1 Tax=Arsenicicoccus bolidensis TaxID=229480 RepID=A0ABS9Q706_9MICO|nr:TniB family NTP-binding protein [Arsenicicoccus bolidensis]MCG7323657.1 TniB family NTP-binding protein [Arsenicicoccus bolidensis]